MLLYFSNEFSNVKRNGTLEIFMKWKFEMVIVEIILSLALGGVMVQSQFTAKANSFLGLQTGAQPVD